MKTIHIGIFLTLGLLGCSPKTEKGSIKQERSEEFKLENWLNFDYQHAKAYVTSSAFMSGEIIKNGKLIPQVWDTTGVELSEAQVKRLGQILTQPDPEEAYLIADCFYPRHGIVFWDKENQPVAYLSICFECNQMKAKPSLQKLDLAPIQKLIEELGIPVFDNPLAHEAYFKKLNRKDTR